MNADNYTDGESHQVKKKIYKIIVIGDSNVGKTCLTFRFCAGRFPEKTEATIGVDFRERTIFINDTEVTVRNCNVSGLTPLLFFVFT